MENNEIGKRIKERRMEIGISIIDLANATGLSKATLHRYENGDIKNIKLPVIREIAYFLSTNPAWLIGKSNIKERSESEDRDINVIIKHLSMLMKDNNLHYKGKPIDPNIAKVIDKTLQLALDLLEEQK